jgi:hypothetical protein
MLFQLERLLMDHLYRVFAAKSVDFVIRIIFRKINLLKVFVWIGHFSVSAVFLHLSIIIVDIILCLTVLIGVTLCLIVVVDIIFLLTIFICIVPCLTNVTGGLRRSHRGFGSD